MVMAVIETQSVKQLAGRQGDTGRSQGGDGPQGGVTACLRQGHILHLLIYFGRIIYKQAYSIAIPEVLSIIASKLFRKKQINNLLT